MAVLQHLYLLTEFLLDQLNHLLMERTGIAHRCAFFDARGESNDLCPTVNEQLVLCLHTTDNTYFHYRICLVVTLECKGTKNPPYPGDMEDFFVII